MQLAETRGGLAALGPPWLAALSAAWERATAYQRLGYVVGAVLMLSGLFRGVILLVSGDPLVGDVSFRKPATFGLSFGMTLFTLAWFLDYFPRQRFLGWATMVALAASTAYEVLAVTVQRWRGVASHFNFATPFDEFVFESMGIAVAVVGTVIVFFTIWSFFSLRAEPAVRWSIRLGLVLLVAAQAFGATIITHGLAIIEAGESGPFNVFGTAGAMKLPHFAAMHAIQVLPAIALLALAGRSETSALRLVLFASSGYVLMLGYTVVQTYGGLAPLDLTPLSGAMFVVGALLLIGSFATALTSYFGQQTRASAPAA